MSHMKAVARRTGTYRHMIDVRSHHVSVDEPLEAGGDDTAPSPQELLAVSLASCTAITMEMYAQRKGWDLGYVEVECEYTPAERGCPTKFELVMRVPEDVTDEQLMADLGPNAEAPPPWLFEENYPGFPGETLPGQTNLALVDLSPGRYLVLSDTIQQFEVIGDAATPMATPEAEVPIVDGTVRLFDFNFEFPDTIAAGRQIWAVTNTGEQPHELLLARSPQPVTTEQVMELMAGESEEATPTGGGSSFADFEPAGGMGWLSPGLTAWTEVDLEPGTYVALCFVFDPETGLPHVAHGMVAVFTVGEPGATPVP